MKLYIVGSTASGKSTLARQIAKRTHIPCFHLDEVVYEEDPTDSWGNRKRTEQQRDALFHEILARQDYVIEDCGRAYFFDGMLQADTVILLDIPRWVRKKRIMQRYIKQKLGIEKCIYKPNLGMVKLMFGWLKVFDTGEDGGQARIAQVSEKTVVLHNNREISAYLDTLKE